MRIADIPQKFNIPFANNAGPGFIRPVPQPSQVSLQAGAASLYDGFPPANFSPIGAGGVPPFGQDMNGILNQITKWSQWQGAGGTPRYDKDFADAIGGYPIGAIVSAAYAGGLWLCVIDNNTSNPDQGGAGWIPFFYQPQVPVEYWVSPGGSDFNDGRSIGTPFLTLQKAANQVPLYNLTATAGIIVNTDDGTYDGVNCPKINGSGGVLFKSLSSNQSACRIVGINKSAVTISNVGGVYTFDGFGIGASGTGICAGFVVSGNTSGIQIGNTTFLNTIDGSIILGQGATGGNSPAATWTINGGASGRTFPGDFLQCYGAAIFQIASGSPPTIVVLAPGGGGTHHFTGAFVDASFNSFTQLYYNGVITGATYISGKRYSQSGWSNISTPFGTGGANYYPGDVAGTSTNGGYA